jgi:hypothetical protein
MAKTRSRIGAARYNLHVPTKEVVMSGQKSPQELFPNLFAPAQPSSKPVSMRPEEMRLLQFSMRQAGARKLPRPAPAPSRQAPLPAAPRPVASQPARRPLGAPRPAAPASARSTPSR